MPFLKTMRDLAMGRRNGSDAMDLWIMKPYGMRFGDGIRTAASYTFICFSKDSLNRKPSLEDDSWNTIP